MSLIFQTHQVTTEVFTSEMSDGTIPWWVWLLAAIFGLLLLALIIFCLYKVHNSTVNTGNKAIESDHKSTYSSDK